MDAGRLTLPWVGYVWNSAAAVAVAVTVAVTVAVN
jgi:hypothetical protein